MTFIALAHCQRSPIKASNRISAGEQFPFGNEIRAWRHNDADGRHFLSISFEATTATARRIDLTIYLGSLQSGFTDNVRNVHRGAGRSLKEKVPFARSNSGPRRKDVGQMRTPAFEFHGQTT
ncbi:hypothetical protein [Aminobacter niigataensis]|uniref:hypothetical protein n=1 Tax=Aminobacter niigataensis TaxID=83265 RepID=UPI00298F0520|nr:hypothetical protein [Aminobacter niigataensis]